MAESNGILQDISKRLGKHRLFYVCRDVERAAGFDLAGAKNYFVITNGSSYAKILARLHPNIITVRSKEPLDTRELLEHRASKKNIRGGDFVVVFKNTPQIEKICEEKNWVLLNPSAYLAGKVEEKISQISWLGELAKYLPPHRIELCKNIAWNRRGFIVQFNRSHTGSGTVMIDSKEKLDEIKNKFPEREARVVDYVGGPLFTNNNIVWGSRVLCGNISYQITGLSPFTDNRFATIGNDWALPEKILGGEQKSNYREMAQAVGAKLAVHGWKGLFGIDAVMDETTKKIFLIEINARQPASTSFESVLQANAGNGITTFEAHLASLLGAEAGGRDLQKIGDGAQIIQRVTKTIDRLRWPKIESQAVINVIKYENAKLDSDLVRIQCREGIMDGHNVFNETGRAIQVAIMSAHRSTIWNSARAGVILIKDGRLLLMKRGKYGNFYYSMVGGTVEQGEEVKATAEREVREETNLEFKIDERKKPLFIRTHRNEYYFFGKNIAGREKLGGPEMLRNTASNSYELEWVDLGRLPKLNLQPKKLKRRLLESVSK